MKLNASVTGISTNRLININVNQSHSSATSIATVACVSHSLDIGDEIEIQLGYTTGISRVFTGYVKQIERKTPDSSYTITAYDDMIRAIDYFVVSSTPDNTMKRQNISAEDLISDVLSLAGLSNFDFDASHFTLAIGVEAEINLVGAYDYAKSIADYVAWNLWCDKDGTIKFFNRKPYPMTGGSGQPGDSADSPITHLYTSNVLSYNLADSEKNLRNRVVVYGSEGVAGEAHSGQSFDPLTGGNRQILPSNYYKTIVFATPLITQSNYAQDACDYNLDLYNRLTYEINISIIGDPTLEARHTITLTDDLMSWFSERDWYIYQLEHSWSKGGYITNLALRL